MSDEKDSKVEEVETEVVPTEEVKQGNTLPAVIQPGGAVEQMLTVDDVKARFQALDELIKAMFRKDRDYGTIPGTKKPTLLKPGAEKMCQLFGVAPRYTIVEAIEDHLKEWEYERVFDSEWNAELKRKEIVGSEKRKTCGFYFYRVKCELVNKGSGVVMGDCIATFCSTEPGREEAPGNTILKMAEKRALVGATANVSFSSDRFTQDMEDTPDTHRRGGVSKKDQTKGILASMKSKLSGGFCWVCMREHIEEGDEIVKFKHSEKGEKWASKACFMARTAQATQSSEKAADGQENDSQEHKTDGVKAKANKPPKSNGKTPMALQKEAEILEADVCEGWPEDDVVKLRLGQAGSTDLLTASNVGLQNYIEHLQKLKENQ